ncbi:hypothetical protein BJ170DRAFT_603855 [Xylariales sp. AK1849]|nr:hypothetical protein BJ170DRAFT_603855 [Xylariales sp. AK1849]
MIIIATDYNRSFRFLDETYATPATADVRGINHQDDVTIGTIGFVRPAFGAIARYLGFPSSSSLLSYHSWFWDREYESVRLVWRTAHV